MPQQNQQNTLNTVEARNAFRNRYYDAAFRAAFSLTNVHNQAEALTELLFQNMENRFEHAPLPNAVDLYILSQTHLLYAKYGASIPAMQHGADGSVSSAKATEPQRQQCVPAQVPHPNKPAQPQPAQEPLQQPAQPQPAQEPLQQPTQSQPTQEPVQQPTQSQPTQEPVQQPAQPQSTQQSAPVQPAFYPLVFSAAPNADGAALQPILFQAVPVVLNGGATPFAAVAPAPSAGASTPDAAQQEAPASTPVSDEPAASTAPSADVEAPLQFNPHLTEVWAPDSDMQDVPAQAAQSPGINADNTGNADADNGEAPQSARSIPLTILNSFLLICALIAVVFLLSSLIQFPKLF